MIRRLAGSLLFSIGMTASVAVFAPILVLLFAAPFGWRYAVARAWSGLNLALLQTLCGIRYTVAGRKHIPAHPSIVFCKHQSAWETLALQHIFPPQVWVLKRELLWIPLFGWALGLIEPIAIDRRAGRKAVATIVREGSMRLRAGRWIVVFPEGTRVAPGTTKRWGIGGAVLAARSGYPVVPVAHNAGELWPRRGFLKRPGTVRVVIGPAIDTRGRTPGQINGCAREWIEEQMGKLTRCAAAASSDERQATGDVSKERALSRASAHGEEGSP